jgi:hypothetical protein
MADEAADADTEITVETEADLSIQPPKMPGCPP